MNTKLIVVDMVNGFCKEGALADSNIMKIVPAIQDLIDTIGSDNTYFLCDYHKEYDLEFLNYPKHCLEGTKESLVINELLDENSYAAIVEKNTTNGFYAMLPYIKTENVKYIICGCLTSICVAQLAIAMKTYFNSINSNCEVVVVDNAVADINKENHDRSLNYLKNNGVVVYEC